MSGRQRQKRTLFPASGWKSRIPRLRILQPGRKSKRPKTFYDVAKVLVNKINDMTWYAVHAVVSSRRRDGVGRFSVSENIFLVEADSAQNAHNLGAKFAEVEAHLDDGLTLDDAPAIRKLQGIRKVVQVSNPEPLNLDLDRPVSGTELSYLEFEVDSESELDSFMCGDELSLRWLD
jgi:hypothetical protein